MKALKKLLFATVALAAASITAAPAATVTIHLAGSTAYRSAVHNAIAHILTSPTGAYIGGNLAGASYSVIQGTVGSDTVIFETAWNGSITGIKAITAPSTNKFPMLLPGGNTLTAVTASGQSNFYSPYGLAPGVSGGSQVASSGTPATVAGATLGTTYENANADVAFSDLFQSTAGLADAVAKTPTLAANRQGVLGILPFAFVKGAANTGDADYATWQRITDVTSNNVVALYQSGQFSAQLITNNSADLFVFLSATGRDVDSGTRGSAFAESGFGVGNAPTQETISVTTAGPAGTVTGITPTTSGESSGGTLASKISTPGFDSAVGGYPLAYLGASDTDTLITEGYAITVGVTGGSNTYTAASLNAVGSGSIATGNSVYVDTLGGTALGTVTGIAGNVLTLSASIPAGTHTLVVDTKGGGYVRGTFLTFNGVALNKSNIQNGKYQYWEYEHYYLAAAPTTYVTSLINQLVNTDANVAGYYLSDMTNGGATVFKNSEGQPINIQ